MKLESGKVRKPWGLTDEEWIAILRVWAVSHVRYVFCSVPFCCALAVGAFVAWPAFVTMQPDGWPHFRLDAHRWRDAVTILVFLPGMVAGLRSIDWRGKRRTARAAGL